MHVLKISIRRGGYKWHFIFFGCIIPHTAVDIIYIQMDLSRDISRRHFLFAGLFSLYAETHFCKKLSCLK